MLQEVLTGVERRRRWSVEEKLSIVAEACAEGINLSDVVLSQ
ncbi:transposase [Rhizobiales bacterium GAS188]|nr:transposase [Rhizobiales bacterium GAS188]